MVQTRRVETGASNLRGTATPVVSSTPSACGKYVAYPSADLVGVPIRTFYPSTDLVGIPIRTFNPTRLIALSCASFAREHIQTAHGDQRGAEQHQGTRDVAPKQKGEDQCPHDAGVLKGREKAGIREP